MKKRMYLVLLAGICWLFTAQPVNAMEGHLGGKDWSSEGKLQIDLSNPQWTNQENQHTLTTLEQWGIELFTPQADARVAANQNREKQQTSENRANIFIKNPGMINQTVERTRLRLFEEPVQVNRETDYQVRKNLPQPPGRNAQRLSQLLLILGGLVLSVSLALTWKSKHKKDWKEGMSHGSHAS